MSVQAATRTFSDAHRLYVKSLYKRYLTNSLNWAIRRDLWREQALEIRAEFERHRNVRDPRALAQILEDAEMKLAAKLHPDPYITAAFPGGTKWERNMPPPPNAFIEWIDHAEEPQQDLSPKELEHIQEIVGDTSKLSKQELVALSKLAEEIRPVLGRMSERERAEKAEKEGKYLDD